MRSREEVKNEMRNLIKHKMLDLKRDDFVGFLAEILHCSRQTASNKLNGSTDFTESEIAILSEKLNFSADELKQALEVK